MQVKYTIAQYILEIHIRYLNSRDMFWKWFQQGFWNPREELSEFVYFPKWSVSSVFKVDVLKENEVKIGIFKKALD